MGKWQDICLLDSSPTISIHLFKACLSRDLFHHTYYLQRLLLVPNFNFLCSSKYWASSFTSCQSHCFSYCPFTGMMPKLNNLMIHIVGYHNTSNNMCMALIVKVPSDWPNKITTLNFFFFNFLLLVFETKSRKLE